MAITKVDDRGLNTPIDLLDNEKIRLGTGNDLEIYHDGTDGSRIISTNVGLEIKETGGFMRIRSDELKIQAATGNETYIEADANGAVQLFYDNSKKFETYANGCTVTGNLNAGNVDLGDSAKARFGASNDLEIYHNGTNSYITNATGGLNIAGSNVGFTNVGSTEWTVQSISNGAVELYYDGTKMLETTSLGTQTFGDAQFEGNDGTDNALKWDKSDDTLYFRDNYKASFGTGGDLQIYHDGSNSLIENTTGTLLLQNSGQTTVKGSTVQFENAAGTEVLLKAVQDGEVQLYHNNSKQFETSSTGTTTFGTHHSTSDIALKTDIQPLTNPLEKIQQITGYKYKFKKSNELSIGVIAQDVEKVFPELVNGSEGEKTLQYNGLIGVLVEAVKELSAEIKALKAK